MPRVVSALLPAIAVAAAVAAGLFVVALSGGSYDVVDRQTAAVVIWWAVGLGALVFAPPQRPGLPGVVATAMAAGIALWIALNLGHSISKERTVVELGRAVTHLGPLVLIGWVLPQRLWRGVFAGLLIAAVGMCVASLGQRLSPGFLGQDNANVFATTNARLASPLGYWNAVGSWSVLTAMMLLAVSAHHPRVWVRGAALAFLPLVATVGYLTFSRATIGALVIGLVVLLLLAKSRWTQGLHIAGAALGGGIAIAAVRGADAIELGSGTAGAGSVLVAVIAAGAALAALAAATGALGIDRRAMPLKPARAAFAATVVLAIVAGTFAVDRYGQKAWDQFNTPELTENTDLTSRLTSLNGTRLRQWRVALDAYRADKAHGTGAGTFELTYNVNGKSSEFVRDAHNAYVESLSEQGWPGFLLLVGLSLSMAAVVAAAARRARTALDRGLIAAAGAGLAAFTFGTVVDWFWEVTALALLALGLLGVAIAAGKPEAVATPRRRGALGRAAAVVALAVLAVLIQLPGLVGTSEVRRSEREVAAGNLTAARAHADQASDIMYWASSPLLQRALVDERAGAFASARTSLRLAIQRDPLDWRLPLVLARVNAESGRPNAALAAFRTAKRLRPGGGFFR